MSKILIIIMTVLDVVVFASVTCTTYHTSNYSRKGKIIISFKKINKLNYNIIIIVII